MITPPKLPAQHPDRTIENQVAIEPEFRALAEAAEVGGRSGEEVAVALLEVAIARIETTYANLDTDEVVRQATQRVAAVEEIEKASAGSDPNL